MRLNIFLDKLSETPQYIDFKDTMSVIDANYNFTETSFTNGELLNLANENLGSCKLFSFAQLHHLDESQTLACFGCYYREDVLKYPQANDHQNIRQFMRHGWQGIHFPEQALIKK